MRALRGNKRVQFGAIGAVLFLAVCLVAFLMYNIFTNNAGQQATANQPATATPEETASTEEESTDTEGEDAEPEPTDIPTKVPTLAPTETPEESPTEIPTETPTAQPTTAADEFSNAPAPQTRPVVHHHLGQLFTNADFEGGFANGVADGWQAFQTDGVLAIFAAEQQPYIDSGEGAQRVTLVQATQTDRYAGLYQQVDVFKGTLYTMTLHGHIRSTVGDIEQSGYGYRMQYGIDYSGGTNWQNVREWTELPWDETTIGGAHTTLYSYTTNIKPTTNKMTLFVRGWNKWIIPGEAQYTLDNFSLVGPREEFITYEPILDDHHEAQPVAMTPSNDESTENENDLLPVTGSLNVTELTHDGRLWISLLLITLITIGLIYGMIRER